MLTGRAAVRAESQRPRPPISRVAAAAARIAPRITVVTVTRWPPLTHTGGDQAAHAGEMRVNFSGDPGQDDYGLPPVDIEVPDDARELHPDVQAYYRPLRTQRRRGQRRRPGAPHPRRGAVPPLRAR